ncbi:hypothetical protein Poli38472_007508 [Pythium oligandrum]|uniref:Mannosyl-oligosaccharide glucosidase n=1 Tax=Pythium oligandrum TaxID=41045 RepID=A0A8K1CQA4_PYTOL|nr:hypothetical protein Poli38472_007508 [Pythium oligandrum]|eukprot:TMW67836.1 hypothetical protein Poli38472_007508 [Pythium oligandrum]
MAATVITVVIALLAVIAALWTTQDGSGWLQRLTTSKAPSPASSEPQETFPPLDFEALREYTRANSLNAFRWGTYRSGFYYGLRSRSYPYAVSAGLLWSSSHEDISQLRHECRQEDRLQKYGWLQHDGRTYGMQSIEDQFNRVELKTYYQRVNQGQATDGWASRISVLPLEPRDERLKRKKVDQTKLSLFYYVDLGCGDETVTHPCRSKLQGLLDVVAEPTTQTCGGDDIFSCTTLTFQSEGLNDAEDAPLEFLVQAQLKTRVGASIKKAELRYGSLKDAGVVNIKERLVASAERPTPQEDAEVVLDNIIEEGTSVVVIQVIVEFDAAENVVQEGDITLDVVMNEGSTTTPDQLATQIAQLDETLAASETSFQQKFEDAFQLSTKGFNSSEIAFAQAAFGNLIGGISFFYGSSLVQHDPFDPTVLESDPKPLFTAVPSRSFFPRGFVWDEGFHQLGISVFDEEITRDIMVHWLGLMEEDGYIAREQILGETARHRVPGEFLVQHVEHANPPTLLLALEKIITYVELDQRRDTMAFIRRIFPFLKRWYEWLVRTQRGVVFNDELATFRWRGRNANDGKLISNTLSSGLDDYPRASTVSDEEMHVDLLCWMIKASGILAKVADLGGLGTEKIYFIRQRDHFRAGLERVHWNEEYQSFFDLGDHSEDGHIEQQVVIRCRNDQGHIRDATTPYEALRQQQQRCPPSHPNYMFPLGDGQGGLKLQPVFVPGSIRFQHVRHVGYVSLFPLLLKLLPADSPKLEALLVQIADPSQLWSPFGLRSMSTRDLFYEQENAQGDNPYWRGSIWINMNYLAISALHHYAGISGPYQTHAQQIYNSLRKNVISNIYSEYTRSGYLWEQYSGNINAGDHYGRGQRCHPFSGWTALVVNIMAENY